MLVDICFAIRDYQHDYKLLDVVRVEDFKTINRASGMNLEKPSFKWIDESFLISVKKFLRKTKWFSCL